MERQRYERHEVEQGIRHACLAAGVPVTELAVALGLNPRALFNYTNYPAQQTPRRKASLEEIAEALFRLGRLSLRFSPEDFSATWGPQR